MIRKRATTMNASKNNENTYKKDLINAIARRTYLDELVKDHLEENFLNKKLTNRGYQKFIKFLTEEIVNATFDMIVEDVSNDKDVKIHRFGTFTADWNKAKKGINPKTKEPIIHDPYLAVKFRASNIFKDAVRNKEE